MPSKLGYWKLRGLGHAIRMVLHYKEVEYEDKMYTIEDGVWEEWVTDKFSLGLDWPNLPYYMDGDVKLTETSAIFAYLGRKYNLGGTTEASKIRNDVTYSVAFSIRIAFYRLVYSSDYNKEPFVEGLSGKLEQFSKVLGEDNFFGGSELVYSDFYVYDLLDVLNQFEPGCVEKFYNLKAFMERIEALPTLKKFLFSEDGMKNGPFTAPSSHWGGSVLK